MKKESRSCVISVTTLDTAQNCHAPDYQHNPRGRAPICQLCNNFGHTKKYCKMNKNFGERRKIMCYKCNNFGHIAWNCQAPDDPQNPRSRALVCQLCNNFGHIEKYCRMDRNFKDRRRKFVNRRNDRRNVKNDQRNHERNSKRNKDSEEQRNVVSEF